MKSKWLLGAILALGGAGYAMAQDSTEKKQPPPPPAQNDNQPPPANDNKTPPPPAPERRADAQTSGTTQVEGRTTTGAQVEGRTTTGTQVEGRATTGAQVEGRRVEGQVDVQTGRRVEGQAVEGQVDAQGRPIRVEGQVGVDRSARSMNFHRAKQVLGSKVSIEGGLAIGTVDDIVFADDGMVEFVVVANEGKLVSVPWAAAKFDFKQRQAIVGITQDKFQQIPTFTAENYPNFDTQYVQRTYSYYNVPQPTGVTPRQERRMDRRVERGRRP